MTGVLIAAPFLPDWSHVTPGGAGVGIGRTSDGRRAAGLPTLALDRSRYEPKEIVMNLIRHLRRVAAALAGLAAALLATATPAFAVPPPPEPPGWNKHPPLPSQVHTVVIGGMPGGRSP